MGCIDAVLRLPPTYTESPGGAWSASTRSKVRYWEQREILRREA